MATPEPLAGAAFAEEMETWQREALHSAVIILTDDTLQSIRMIEPELVNYENLPFTAFLPPWRSWRAYSHRFLLNLALCVFEMGHRLMQPQWDFPRCTGEEIALWTILCQAELTAEMTGREFDPEDLVDVMFEDGDFLAYYSEIPEDEMRELAARHDVTLEPKTGSSRSDETARSTPSSLSDESIVTPRPLHIGDGPQRRRKLQLASKPSTSVS